MPILPAAKRASSFDGATHSTQSELASDKKREDFLRAEGYRIIRFTNADVYEQADCVFDAILAALGGRGSKAIYGRAFSSDRPLTLPLPISWGEGRQAFVLDPAKDA